jgi:hypothetical protein
MEIRTPLCPVCARPLPVWGQACPFCRQKAKTTGGLAGAVGCALAFYVLLAVAMVIQSILTGNFK